MSLITAALRTKKRFKIGLLRQLRESAYLRFSESRLDPWEYYFFQVYLDSYPMEEKKRFAGWRREVNIDRIVNTGPARDLANDKLLFHQFMGEQGAPLPKMRAVFATGNPVCPGAAQLESPDHVVRHLQNPANMPVFVKPVRGTRGRNAWAILGPSGDRRDLVMSGGSRVALRDFVSGLDDGGKGGFMFQELLRTHDAVGRVCGDRLTSVRSIVVVTPDGPEILSAVWRIPTGANATDNFDVGRTRNIVAGIDLETGRARRFVQGDHWRNIDVDAHPDTGVEFGAFELPHWRRITDLCLTYASVFAGLRLQHWDIALTDRGPVILELNVAAGMRTHQIVTRRGIVGERLQQLVSDTSKAETLQ